MAAMVSQVNSTLAAARVLSALQHLPQRLLRRKRQQLSRGPVNPVHPVDVMRKGSLEIGC